MHHQYIENIAFFHIGEVPYSGSTIEEMRLGQWVIPSPRG